VCLIAEKFLRDVVLVAARQFDYFDSGIMEGLQYQLVVQAETMALDRMPGSNLTLYSKVCLTKYIWFYLVKVL